MNAIGPPLIEDRERIVRRGIRLEWFTIVYNSMEGILALMAGFLAGSIALVGFGFDSAIEVTSGAALLWRLGSDRKHDSRAARDLVALRIVGCCFLALAAYVAYDGVRSLLSHEAPRHSAFGIAVAVASLIVMPVLARAKRRVAASLGSAALVAEARQTDVCMYLSAILLSGLVLNLLFRWWWADPVAALAMVPIIAREGFEALKGERSCSC